jgi:WhiB family transcriptional regulator, redox-sensing transcriptional regulator
MPTVAGSRESAGSGPRHRWLDVAILEDAACARTDSEVFFPRGHVTEAKITDARAVCGSCPVRLLCLAYALANDELYGIWGGLTPEERQGRWHPQVAGEGCA